MSLAISGILQQFELDSWRTASGFSEDIQKANDALFKTRSEDEAASILNAWIGENQPCLFGKHGSKVGLISYCILLEQDLIQDDRHIRDKIARARTQWNHEAFEGSKSAFVILAVSEKIASARPSVGTREFAQRLAALYLLEPVTTDEIYLDSVELEVPGKTKPTFRWDAGVNYFCAQGDKRWWQDHRIPGGMAFSVNSVGHMVRSSKLSKAIQDFHKTMGISEEEWSKANIDNLPKALLVAMKTINQASETVSGKATKLIPLPSEITELPQRPIELPANLADKNYCEYSGGYHTDVTLPSAYFQDDIERPENLDYYALDFTYLFDDRLENPDFINMGEGRQIRFESGERSNLSNEERFRKRKKAVGRPVNQES